MKLNESFFLPTILSGSLSGSLSLSLAILSDSPYRRWQLRAMVKDIDSRMGLYSPPLFLTPSASLSHTLSLSFSLSLSLSLSPPLPAAPPLSHFTSSGYLPRSRSPSIVGLSRHICPSFQLYFLTHRCHPPPPPTPLSADTRARVVPRIRLSQSQRRHRREVGEYRRQVGVCESGGATAITLPPLSQLILGLNWCLPCY